MYVRVHELKTKQAVFVKQNSVEGTSFFASAVPTNVARG